jgi:hypothetical protein
MFSPISHPLLAGITLAVLILISVIVAPALLTGELHEALRLLDRVQARLTSGGLEAVIFFAAPDESITSLRLAIVINISTPLKTQAPIAGRIFGCLMDYENTCHSSPRIHTNAD